MNLNLILNTAFRAVFFFVKNLKLTFHLLKFPELGKAVELSDYRVFIIDNYSLFYKVLETEIFIALFWDNRRSPDLFLSELSKTV